VLVDGYFARQPILDRRGVLYAYEVLFRPGPVNKAHFVDGDAATAQVLANLFSDVEGSDPLGGHPAFVNVPRNLILRDVAHAFPNDRMTIEVLEDVEPDAEIVDALVRLRRSGYKVALDDYVADDRRRPLVPYVDLIKLDVMAIGSEALPRVVASVAPLGTTLLAEKVETRAEYERCLRLGIELFQGYYFAKPELVVGRRLDEGRVQLLRLLADLHRPDIEVGEVARAVESHPNLSFQVLRILNSVRMGLPRQVSSIREAVVMVGGRRLTELATLLVLAAHDHKPRELLSLGLVRGRMCENVAVAAGLDDPASYFTVGVFSVFDALTDTPMDRLLAGLPLAADVKLALIGRAGPKGLLLDAAIAYERGDWMVLDAGEHDASVLSGAYLGALDWSHELLGAL
jgi:EAL and modified HD-GYP domain-containing signal transduction protein